MIGNLADMAFQWDWGGDRLINKRILVHKDELDKPQRQLGTLVLPPDPEPLMNARPEQYSIDEWPVSTRYTIDGSIRVASTSGAQPFFANRVVSVAGD